MAVMNPAVSQDTILLQNDDTNVFQDKMVLFVSTDDTRRHTTRQVTDTMTTVKGDPGTDKIISKQ